MCLYPLKLIENKRKLKLTTLNTNNLSNIQEFYEQTNLHLKKI